MVEQKKQKIPTWFTKEFPTEWYFTDKFADKLLEFLQKMPDDKFFEFMKKPEFFTTENQCQDSNGNPKIALMINEYFLILFGMVASIISEAMSEAMKESQIKSSTNFGEIVDRMVKHKVALDHPTEKTSDHKKCNSCATENRGTARYCDNCGLSFSGE